MKLSRRELLHLAAGAAAVPVMPRIANAQSYPTRPVHLIVPFAPGGPVDLFARLIGQWLSEHLGQPLIIENRAGAAGNLGTEAVVRSAADGYTLLMCGTWSSINATLYDHLSFNFIRDIAPVASINRGPGVMEVNPMVPAKTVPEFIAYAKAHPVNFGSAGVGSPGHVSGELFKAMAGVNMVHVPYRGAAPAITDLLSGRLQVMFDSLSTSIEHVRSGRLRALAVSTASRAEALPDIPTLSDFVPGYEFKNWNGVGAPKDTPPQIIGKLNSVINAGLADAKIKARITEMGYEVLAGSPDDLQKLIADTTEKFGTVIRAANIKLE